ncbi:type II secretion system protein N [uncultured Halopseudomonas sp.]|uniref:type II secretion system protein N n=1 Tax=uncultured Halopseudomonas sp. TaxID=2901193 RepID=UPI0030EE36E2|tara:strand:- start:12141 stop:13004 length:864 start_codon:yes stop_codon:yes gene_type:complete
MPLDARFPLDSSLRLLVIVLVAITAILLGRLTWTVVEPQSVLPSPAPSPLTISDGSAGGARGGFAEVAGLSVFGSAAGKQRNAALNAPDTSLSWILKGVLTDPDPERSTAILAPQGQAEKAYRVGASLPGNVRLEQVLADRVILARDGKLETLRLQRASLASSKAPARRAAALPQVDPNLTIAADGGVARIDREEWMNNPQRFMEVVSATPVLIDGAMYGLEVSPARNAREFEAAGLQSGDVVTAVEGTPVAEINDYRDILQTLTGNTVSLSLDRNGEPMTITITMD